MAVSVRAGFSLLELLVVLVIMGLVTSLAVPALRPAHPRVRPGDGLGAFLLRTQRCALMTGRGVEVLLSADGHRAVATGIDERKPPCEGTYSLPAGTSASSTAGGSASSWQFARDGRVTASAVSVSADGETATITFDPWTGRMRLAGMAPVRDPIAR